MNDNEKNIDRILESLARSKFRAGFRLKGKLLTYAGEKGIDILRKHASDFVSARIAPADIPNDGKQTPMRNHPVFVAQHATATCCRGCIEKWHRIPKGRELTDDEQSFIVNLIIVWIERQLSDNFDV